MEQLLTLLTVLSPILTALITGVYSVKQSKVQKGINEKQEKMEKQAELRRKESLLSMKMASANTKLTIGIAMAMKHGHCNGEVEEGLKAVHQAEADYDSFLKEIAINDINT